MIIYIYIYIVYTTKHLDTLDWLFFLPKTDVNSEINAYVWLTASSEWHIMKLVPKMKVFLQPNRFHLELWRSSEKLFGNINPCSWLRRPLKNQLKLYYIFIYLLIYFCQILPPCYLSDIRRQLWTNRRRLSHASSETCKASLDIFGVTSQHNTLIPLFPPTVTRFPSGSEHSD